MNLDRNFKNFKFKTSVKKAIVLALSSAFIVTGIGITQLPQSIANANAKQVLQKQDQKRGPVAPEVMAQDIQDSFGIDKQTILTYHDQGWKMPDLRMAAFISYASDKPFSEVLNAKTMTNDWREVSESFGVTKEKMQTLMQSKMSKQMAENLGVAETVIDSFLSKGYHPHDISMAIALSKHADKSIDEIINMKKINNRWSDVAASLGINDQDYQESRDLARQCGPMKQGWHSKDKAFGMHHKDCAPPQGAPSN